LKLKRGDGRGRRRCRHTYESWGCATTDPSYGLTVYNSQTGAYSMTVGLVWWLVGVALAVGYFVFLYRSFRGKVRLGDAA
jgi:cytochrome bd-type quinol oxidase subunit 2